MTTQTVDAALAATTGIGVVNGPTDLDFRWDAVRWRRAEEQVRRLRQRIFTAAELVEHAGQRAAGHAAQRWSFDRGD